ncbi:5-dehydro-2-deoxygluconokinase [Terrabacter sp. MAHUQ-38]|uniref:5-dehydro-2-deoxygluconokinase n=1 Tax=unclassified Terrabacter TaxID=2630222 RepID=UPI00165DCD07|nr:5-dehydro-2-deoxygluconokinase [Terrabacter sp. MAHUQ-38]MBC9820354.1 5-dehydro-2-deoxygluconokinase [Terrabacter sp. MAHUQ-38]
MTAYDLVALGRVGVDLYPLQHGVTLDEVRSFEKFLGGSAANVTVAAARHGRRAALVSATADDAFGRFVHRELLQLGVDDAHVQTIAGGPPTPVTFCEVFPPDHFPIWFYRYPTAPDLLITADSIPLQAIREARVHWSTVTGLSQEPSRAAHVAAWQERGRAPLTVLDLDYRAVFWSDVDEARRQVREAVRNVTVAVGNTEECEVATGETDPERAARALLASGVELAVVKQGPRGVLAMTQDERVTVSAFPVDVVNGLGAGDAFGGALVHGLLEGWDLERILHFANVAGALVAGRLECSTAMPTTAEVQALLSDVEVADGAM